MVTSDAVQALVQLHNERWSCCNCGQNLKSNDSFCERCAQDYNSECMGCGCSSMAIYCDTCAEAKHGPRTVPYPPLGVIRVQDPLDDRLAAFLEATSRQCCRGDDHRCIQCQDRNALLADLKERLVADIR